MISEKKIKLKKHSHSYTYVVTFDNFNEYIDFIVLYPFEPQIKNYWLQPR